MLNSRLSGCNDCQSIDKILSEIDCVLTKYAHDASNNEKYELGQPIPAWKVEKLIKYKNILLKRRFNSSYLWSVPNSDIIARVNTILYQ